MFVASQYRLSATLSAKACKESMNVSANRRLVERLVPCRPSTRLGETSSSLRRLSAVARRRRFASGTAASPSAGQADAAVEEKGATAKDDPGVAGKTVIVTGANTGMGLVAAQELALQGARVIMACRSEDRGRAALKRVKAALQGQQGRDGLEGSAELALLDLSRLDSVRRFVEEIQGSLPHVDILINNAGIMIPPHALTPDGFESQFQVNHLSHYLLTRQLLPQLLSSPSRPKVIHVSSLASENVALRPGSFWPIARRRAEEYNAFESYRFSKLAQVLFTVEMNRRLGNQLTVNAVHPGIVNTELFNRNIPPLVKLALDPLGRLAEALGVMYSSQRGASTAIFLATAPSSTTGSGGYYADCAPKLANPVAFDRELCDEWWNQSALACGIDP